MDLDKIFPKNLYHSYVVSGDDKTTEYIKDFLIYRKEIEDNSPDLFVYSAATLNISSSSDINFWQNNKPSGSNKKICIINTKFINKDAEQTLLKMIEEPKENTHFFIITPNHKILSKTILSRVHVVDLKENQNTNKIEKFIKLNKKERIDFVTSFINDFKDSDGSGELRDAAILFINEIEKIIYNKWKNDLKKDSQFILEELQKCKGYLNTPGASVKMILEYIALVV